MTLVRNSPSGRPIIFDADVLTVFGRSGHVVAEVGDYNDSLVNNDSTAPGGNLEGALGFLRSSDFITNQSGVVGASVSDALDNLLTRLGGVSGYLRDTFTGGALVVATLDNTNARIGDKRWNFIRTGVSSDASCAKRAGSVGAVGVYRLTSPAVLNASAHVYLGASDKPPFKAFNWSEITWRCRVEAIQGANERVQFGLSASPSSLIALSTGAGILCQQNANPNFRSVTSSGGSSAIKDTGVAIDGTFHDFRIVRVSDTVIQFFIDGVLTTTHTSPGDPMPGEVSDLGPLIGAFGGGAATFVDIDDYEFIPT